jgi:hypothetical protein
MKKGELTYLGDGVYAEFDEYDYDIVLTTNEGYGPTNTIVLEPEVVEALIFYVNRIKETNDDGGF